MSTTRPTANLLTVLALCITLLAPAFAAPPVDSTADEITGFLLEPEVAIGETLGVSFTVEYANDSGVPNHHCSVSVYEWRAGIAYPMHLYELTPWCENNLLLDGSGELPKDCFRQTTENGEYYAVLPITYEEGYHVAANNTDNNYGVYQLEAHCGNTADLVETGNFTVLHAAEPTWVIDTIWWSVDYQAQVVLILIGIVLLAIFIYFIKTLIFG